MSQPQSIARSLIFVVPLLLAACRSTPPDDDRLTAPLAAARLDMVGQPSAVLPAAAETAGEPTPGERATRARTLRDLAWAADQVGDARLAAAYRADAAAVAAGADLRSAARPAAPAGQLPVASASSARPAKSATRAAAAPRTAAQRARAARRARAAARAKSPRPQPRGIDRAFSRLERWLGGGRQVARPFP